MESLNQALLIQAFATIGVFIALWHQVRTSNQLRKQELYRRQIEDERDLDERTAALLSLKVTIVETGIQTRQLLRKVKSSALKEEEGIGGLEKGWHEAFRESENKNEEILKNISNIASEMIEIENGDSLSFRQKLRKLRRRLETLSGQANIANCRAKEWVAKLTS